MKLCLISLMWLLPLLSSFPDTTEQAICDCPSVTGLQKTGETSSTVSYTWGSSLASSHYKVWYFRQEGSFTSSGDYTNTTSYTFSNLPSGSYTFYFVTICGEESSGFVGVEEVIVN